MLLTDYYQKYIRFLFHCEFNEEVLAEIAYTSAIFSFELR